MINKNEEIEILNYYKNPKYLVSLGDEYGNKIEGCDDKNEPSMITIPFQDVKHINSKSDVFKIGTLEFGEADREAVLKELKIYPERDVNYYTKNEIREIVGSPATEENIIKIIEITNKGTIDNFRGTLYELINDGYEVSNRIIDYIESRYIEIKTFYDTKKGSLKSSLPKPQIKTYKPSKKDENENNEVEMAVVNETQKVDDTKKKTTKTSTSKNKNK